MSSIDIDVSHIMAWQGRLTGIERVEYHLINYYFNKTEARFVAWDPTLDKFVILEKPDIKRLILEKPFKTDQGEPVKSTRSLINRVVQKLERQLKHTRQSTKSGPEIYEVKSGQNLVVLAGLWDNMSYVHGLQSIQKSGVKLVHVVYDMIPILQPQYIVDFLPPIFESYITTILPICSGVLAISESTARDTELVLKARGLNVPDIKAFRLGDDLPESGPAVKPFGVNDNFFLSVSTIESRKNHILLYYAYKLAAERGTELPEMIIVGKRGWHTENFQYLVENDPVTKDKIRIMDNIDDSGLRWLYENCQAVIFPSFYEGWGLPVAEGLYYGKVVLSSNTSSLPEIGGDLVDYFSPYSSEELLSLITTYHQEPKKLAAREKEITLNYKTVEWLGASKEFDNKLSRIL